MWLIKSKIVSTFVISLSLFLISFSDTGASCITECSYTDSGTGATCFVSFEQIFTGGGTWAFGVTCSDGYTDGDSGTGIYDGTICGGTDPIMCAS
jgi:hypothetical protein